MGQLRHWPEQQRAIRLVVQKAVAGRGIDLDIMWYVVSAQRLSQRWHALDYPVPAAVAGHNGAGACRELIDIGRHHAVVDRCGVVALR